MVDIDPELVERTIHWCAEAGRQTTAPLVRAALSPLSWDEVLAVRALLADPPPARPLGPLALADIARGAPADVAAERERGGRYGPEPELAPATPRDGEAATPSRPRPRRRRGQAPFRVLRASDRAAPAPLPPPALPLVDAILLDEGRSQLERLVRSHGGRRARIVEALAAGWRHADGRPVTGADLDRALVQHGMDRAYAIRERDEILHALRAAGGVRVRAAAALGLDVEGLDAALARLGARADAERLREQRRKELRARGTLTERAHLVLDETERLQDLGLLDEFVRDLAARLPEHLRALSPSHGESLPERLCRSLSLDPNGVERLAQRTGLALQGGPATAARPSASPRSGPRPHGRSGTRSPTRPPPHSTGRPAPRSGGRPPPRSPGRAPPRGGDRTASRPPGRTGGSPSRTGARPPGPKGSRPPRPGGPGPRSGGTRPPKRR